MPTDIPTSHDINAMTDLEYKVLENRLRRAAERQGFRMEKSRARDVRATDYGTYQLVDATNTLASHGLQAGYGLGLDDVARFLFDDKTIHVYPGHGEDANPGHSVINWLDRHNPSREPWIEYRKPNTTKARVKGKLIEDGWVLFYDDGEEYILGAWDGAEEAVVKARDFLHRWGDHEK